MKCDACGKDIGGSYYTDNPFAMSHRHLGGRFCRQCYIANGHPECVGPKCDGLLDSRWKYCPVCGIIQREEGK